LIAEGETGVKDLNVTKAVASSAVKSTRPSSEQVTIVIEEKLTVTLSRDGGVELFDLSGIMALEVDSIS